MKRANHLFEKLIQPETLYKAFRLCSDGKQHYKAVKKFSENLKENLKELQTELENGTYTTGEYRIKTINEHGKERKIHILPYKDRVLQRALGIVLDEYVYRTLTANTHASLEGRGIHSALNQIKKYCTLGKNEREVIEQAFQALSLSARAYHRILKVSRTIADLNGHESIQKGDLFEAIGYRSLDKKYWGKL